MTKLPQEAAVQVEKVVGSVTEQAQAATPRTLSDRPTQRPRKRMTFGSSKLGVDCSKLHEAGFYCHWLNDYPGRISEAQEVGYQFVLLSEIESSPTLGAPTADGGQRVSRRVGVKEDGTELLAYLMKIPLEWKHENDAEYTKRADAIDAQIRSGKVTQVAGTDPASSYYNGGIKMETPRSR